MSLNLVLSANMESGPDVGGVSLCGLLSSKKAFGGISPKGIHHRHTGVSYWIDPSAVSPMCVFDLFELPSVIKSRTVFSL